jgi:hypothetical protein
VRIRWASESETSKPGSFRRVPLLVAPSFLHLPGAQPWRLKTVPTHKTGSLLAFQPTLDSLGRKLLPTLRTPVL